MNDLEMLKLENEMLKQNIKEWKQIVEMQDIVIQRWKVLCDEMKQEATCPPKIS